MTLSDQGHFGYLVDGNCSVHHRLPLKESVADEFLIFGKGVNQPGVEFKQTPSLIFNQISDADTHQGSLERCVDLCNQINTTVINHPRQILQTGRDRVSSLLQNIPGVVMPRTQRFRPSSPEEVLSYAAAEGFAFPYIVRVAGKHHGKNMVRLDSAADLSLLHPLPFDGRDFYLTEYVEYADSNGMYHKQRIVVINGEPVLRHTLFSDNWVVHASARKFMDQKESLEDYMARFDQLRDEVIPAFSDAIIEITKRLQLEYYGIDCCVLPDGQMLVFEANANMNNLNSPSPASRYGVREIEQKLYALLTRFSGEKVN